MSELRKLAAASCALALCGASAIGQASYTNDITGPATNVWGDSAAWAPSVVPGYDVGNATGNSNDSAWVRFFAPNTPWLDLAGSNYVLDTLGIIEDPGGNADGNFISTGGASTLELKMIDYTGGRQIDFFNEITIKDWDDGNAFVVDVDGGNVLDFGGPFQGSDGLVVNGNPTLYFRNFQTTFGTGISNGLIINAGSGTKNFWIDASAGDVVRTIPNLVVGDFAGSSGNVNIDFGRSAGTNMVSVNISNVVLGETVDRLFLGGGSDPDGTETTTVNVFGNIEFAPTNINNLIKLDSVYDGVVNFYGNIVQNEDVGSNIIIFQGNGTARLFDDMIHTNGNLRTLDTRIDGGRGLTVVVDAESRLGAGTIDLRAGSVLKFNYDVFGDPNGYPGGSLTNKGVIDDLNDTHLDFGVLQSGFFDPITGDTGTPLTVLAFNGIAGNLSNAVYSGPGQNIIVQTNAIIGENALNKPTYADVGQSVWAGIRDVGGTYTNIGIQDGTNIFRGIAFSALAPQGNGDLPNTSGDPNVEPFLSGVHGTFSSASGVDLEVLLSGETIITPRTNDLAATFNSDTGVVNFRGPGNMLIQERQGVTALSGTATNINRIGRGGIVSDLNPLGLNDQNDLVMDLEGVSPIQQGDTITVTDGRIRLRNNENLGLVNNNVETTLIISNGASLWMDNNNATGQLNFGLSRGTLVFAPGGALWTGTTTDRAGVNNAVRAAMQIDPDAMLIIDDGTSTGFRDMNQQLFTDAIGAMNIIIADGAFRSNSIQNTAQFALGEGRRLTTSSDENATIGNIILANGTEMPITAGAGVTQILFTAASGRTFNLNVNVDLPTTDLQIGDTGQFTTVVSDETTRATVGQDGTVNIQGASNVFQNIRVVAGTATLGGGFSDAGGVTVNRATLNLSGTEMSLSNLTVEGGGAAVIQDPGLVVDQVTLDNGTLQASTNYLLAAAQGVTLTNVGGTFLVDPGMTLVVSNAIDGDGGLAKTGAGTLILSNNNSYAGGTLIGDGTLLLAAGNDTLSTAGDIMTTGGIFDLGSSTQNTSGGVSFQGGIVTNGVIVKSGGAFDAQSGTIAAALAGSAGLMKTGPSSLVLQNDNAFTGDTIIGGGTLTLNEGGKLSGTTNIIIEHYATFEIDNTAVNDPDRVNDLATLTSRGGTFRFTNDAAAATAYAETMDVLDLQRGNLVFQTVQSAGDGSSTLIFSNATASVARSPGATVRIEAAGLGTNTQNEILLVPGAGLPEIKNEIIPWALVKDGTGGSGADFNLATTNAGTLAGHLGLVGYIGYDTTAGSASWGPTVNARPSGDVTDINANKTLNALVLDNGVNITGASLSQDRILDFQGAGGAALIVQTGGSSEIQDNGSSEYILRFGNNEGIFNTIGDLTFIRGNNTAGIRGTNGFVKTGPGTLILESESSKDPTIGANAMSGNFYVNEGALELRFGDADGSSAGATTIQLNGGDLRLVAGSLNFGNDVVVNEDATITLSRVVLGNGITATLGDLALGAGRTLSVEMDKPLFNSNQGYTLNLSNITLLGDAFLQVGNGTGSGDGVVQAFGSLTDNGGGYDFTLSGNSAIRSALRVLETFTLGGDLTIGTNALLRIGDGAQNVAGNITLVGGILGLNTNFSRALGSGDGQVRLVGDGSLVTGFSAFDNDVVIALGGGTLTNLVWGTPDFDPGQFTLNQDDANRNIELQNDIDLNSGGGTVTRIVNVYSGTARVATISGNITNSGSGTANFQKSQVGILSLTGDFYWNGYTDINGGYLRIPNMSDLPSGFLDINPGNSIGVLETAGLLTRSLGTGENQIRVLGGGTSSQNSRPGFSAFGGDLTIDLGGNGTGTGPEIQWGSALFDPDGPNNGIGGLFLNSANADSRLIFWNDMDLNGESGVTTRRLESQSSGTNAVAILMGDIRNSQAGSNPVGIDKTGPGIVALMGSNSYDGVTTVSGGGLVVNGVHFGGDAYTVASGAFLAGTGTIDAPVSIAAGGFLAPGNSIGTFSLLSNVTVLGTLDIELVDPGAGSANGSIDLLNVAGILDISQATVDFTFLSANTNADDYHFIFATYGSLITNVGGFASIVDLPVGYEIVYDFNGNNIALVIPEPSTWALLAIGFVAVAALARRRRSRS